MTSNSLPSIACIGLIGRHDNPLHIAIFPPHIDQPGAYLEFSFHLNASLDIFELRTRDRNRIDQDLGLLHAVDERLSLWGWETATGTRFVIVLDMWGREGKEAVGMGIREGELKPAFRALQTAYIRLLMNPFFHPDEHTKGEMITSKRFIAEVERIALTWRPGASNI